MKKFNVKIKTIFAAILSLVCLNLSSARADDSDIFGANIEPNVMLLMDTSSSMKSEIPSSIYDPATSYSGDDDDYNNTKVYKQQGDDDDDYNLYKNTVSQVTDAGARAALSTAGYWVGRIGGSVVSLFLGNYLNYRTCQTCTVNERKLDIVKRVYANLIENVQGVRFGVMRLRREPDPPGYRGEMLATIGTDKTTMVNAIKSLVYESGTGLGWQLEDAGQYFKGLTLIDGTSYPSPIKYECQPNFIILMSDGRQKSGHPVENEATLRYTQDHSSSLAGKQNVIVHTVGFDISDLTDADKLVANDSLKDAAENGGGQFFAANNAAELEAALLGAIRQIVEGVFTFATPVVPTTSVTGSTRAYVGAIQSDPDSVFWKGYLKAFDRQADGSILLNDDGTPDASQLAWEAGDALNNPTKATYKLADDRKIYYQEFVNALDPQPRKRQVFTTAKVNVGDVGAANSAERNQIVNFIRGEDVFDDDADANITENRDWILGDIFHSTPVLVSQPHMPINDPSYDLFKKEQAIIDRPSVLIVGANDGMLHAFRESDGEELWAWVPEHVFRDLKKLLAPSGTHPYFVDASPISADIKIDGQWETIVVFGLRRGGSHYYALKITDTTSPELLWSFNDSKLGETWSEPSIGKIKWTDGTDKYVAFVGGGYDTDENNASGKAFFMIDLADGTNLAEYYNDGVTDDDRKYMNFSIPANPTAIDSDGDGYVDRVYVGDVGGQLWRFDPVLTPEATGPTTYKYSFFYEDSLTYREREFMIQFKDGVTEIVLKFPDELSQPLAWPPPADCLQPYCHIYKHDGKDPYNENHDYHLGFIALDLDQGVETMLYQVEFIEEIDGTTAATFELKGKRLFAAYSKTLTIGSDNPPPAGEYLPAQAIYGAPSVALDDKGNLWTYFGSGDRNHPLNTTNSPNGFYGIKDNALIDDVVTLTELDLQLVDSTDDVVSTSEDGWYFVLEGSNEKVLAAAETFDNTVYFTTFTPDSGNNNNDDDNDDNNSTDVCSSGGGTAKLYAVRMTSGFAALDFSTADNDAYAATAKELGTSRWTKIGDGIASKPAVIIDKYGNPSIITGTTSQQISSEKAPKISTTGLLGWMEVF